MRSRKGKIKHLRKCLQYYILKLCPSKTAVFLEKFQPVFDPSHFQKNILEKFGDPLAFACVKHILKVKKICNINITWIFGSEIAMPFPPIIKHAEGCCNPCVNFHEGSEEISASNLVRKSAATYLVGWAIQGRSQRKNPAAAKTTVMKTAAEDYRIVAVIWIWIVHFDWGEMHVHIIKRMCSMDVSQLCIDMGDIISSVSITRGKLDNSKLGSTQQQIICWHWHVARIISSQRIFDLCGLKHHIVEMRGGVTDAWRQTTTTEDRATQPMQWKLEALSFAI